jgi:chemotaxis protein CheX
MNVQEQDIRDITDSVWTNILQTNAASGPECATPEMSGTILTSCVQITGRWEGAVTIQCPIGLARTAASVMFDADPVTVSDADIRDALGELANMVGGNIKALLPGPTHLSLPVVVEGDKQSLSICHAVAVQTVGFASIGEAFVVTLLSRAMGMDRYTNRSIRHDEPKV